MILAAGLGTRLRPWTLEHPKALVPVEGIPMLERVIMRLKSQGFGEIVVNTHHFSGQIVNFLREKDYGVDIRISDESQALLDTGGGIVHAAHYLEGAPFLVHNVDILSNAPLAELMRVHTESGNDITLLTSGRNSSRKLLFDASGNLRGWHNIVTNEYLPSGSCSMGNLSEEAFSGIYVVGENGLDAMCKYGKAEGVEAFPIMEFFLSQPEDIKIRRVYSADLVLLDIGKPDKLQHASDMLKTIS